MTPPDLRQKVYSLIDKLSDRSTFTLASSELNLLAGTLPENDPHSLSTFLTCILSLDETSRPSVRIHCLSLLSLLAETYTYSLCPFLPKLILPSLLRRLRDTDSSVRASCASACASLAPLGLFFILGPLIASATTETETNAQIGACWCLKSAIDGADDVSGADVAEMRKGVVRLVKMVRGEGCTVKAKAAVLAVIGSAVEVNGGEVVNRLVGNVVECAVEMLSCEDWAARKAAAEVLEKVAVVVESELVKEVVGFVVGSLESKRFDKVKATRESMNQALEAWKNIPVGVQQDFPFSTSVSSFSKDKANVVGKPPCVSRRSLFAGIETSKQKKVINKTMSSLYEYPIASNSSSSSTSTPQRKKTMSNSKSCLSDSSIITDSSYLSRSSHDVILETPHSKKLTSKDRYSLPNDFSSTASKKSLDWRAETALPRETVVSEDCTQSHCESETMEVNFVNKTSEKRAQKAGIRRSRSRVVPFFEEEPDRPVVHLEITEEAGEKNADDDLAQIRNQLFQIERQQSDLLDLLMRFMGNSQSRIDSLETRVSGIERALDEISYDLEVQRGRRNQNNGATETTCLPSTEFLSPKFWRKVEGKSSASKSSNSGTVPSNKDGKIEELHEEGKYANKNVKGIGQNNQRGRVSLAPEALMQLRTHLA